MLCVFIPSFNHATYVLEAIRSVRAIDVPKHIYVIDDASTDNTAAVIEQYLGESGASGITFIRKESNRGAIDSMIVFLELCRGEFIYTLASDDIAVPDGIDALVRHLEANPALGFVIGGGDNLFTDGHRTPLYGRKHDALFARPPEQMATAMFLSDPSPLLCQSTVFRLSALRAADAIDPNIVADDYAIFGKLFKHFDRRGETYDFLPAVKCVLYRHHGGNSYLRFVRQAITHSEVIEKIAPPAIRTRAIGYKYAFLMLVALRRRRFGIVRDLVRAAPSKSRGWLATGLFVNAYEWLKYR